MDISYEQLGIALLKAAKLGDKYAGSALEYALRKLHKQMVEEAAKKTPYYALRTGEEKVDDNAASTYC